MRKAIIFDMDGTLLDTLEDLYRSANAALLRYGFPERSKEEIRQFVGNGAVNLMRRAVPRGEENPHFTDCLLAFKEHYGVHLNDHTCAYEGVEELLKTLKAAGYPMAIVSNKPDFAVRELNRRYFGDVIKVAIGESESVRRKPAPDTVECAARELGVELKDCIYVGDSEVDLKTAENCKIPCISVAWGFRGRQFLEDMGARTIAERPQEVHEMISLYYIDGCYT